MEVKFKKGMKVICKSSSKFLNKGNTYTINQVDYEANYPFCSIKEIDDRSFNIDYNFKSLSEIRDEKINKLLGL